MDLTKEQKEEFANKIIDNYDMDTLRDTAIVGILESWKNNPNLLEEEIKNREDLIKTM